MSDRLPIAEGRESMRAVLYYLQDNGTLTLPKKCFGYKKWKFDS